MNLMKYIKHITVVAVLLSLCACGSSEKKTGSSSITPDDATEIKPTAAAKSIVINEDLTIDNSQIVEYPVDNLKAAVQQKLATSGKSLNNVNSDGSVYAVGVASTAVPSNSSGFINSRNIAFAKAELRAKIAILRLSGEVITSNRNSSLVSNMRSGSDPEAKEKASILEKAAAVVDASLDRALAELGVSDRDISQMNEGQKEQMYNEQFYNYVSSFVSSMIKGVTVVKIVEGEAGSNDYQVAVCVKYSPENHNLAARFDQLGASQEQMNDKVINNLRSIDPTVLVSKLGAQIFIDSQGNRVLVGFGQSPIRKTQTRQSNAEDIAFRTARLRAIENIKNMLAEDLVGKETSESIEKIIEYQDGENQLYTEENYSELIESKKTSIRLNTLELRQWKAQHSVSDALIAGSVVILTESNGLFLTGGTEGPGATKKSEYQESKEIEGENF